MTAETDHKANVVKSTTISKGPVTHRAGMIWKGVDHVGNRERNSPDSICSEPGPLDPPPS